MNSNIVELLAHCLGSSIYQINVPGGGSRNTGGELSGSDGRTDPSRTVLVAHSRDPKTRDVPTVTCTWSLLASDNRHLGTGKFDSMVILIV